MSLFIEDFLYVIIFFVYLFSIKKYHLYFVVLIISYVRLTVLVLLISLYTCFVYCILSVTMYIKVNSVFLCWILDFAVFSIALILYFIIDFLILSVSFDFSLLFTYRFHELKWTIRNYIEGPSWSYGSWIYNNLCNQCLSPLKLWDILGIALCDKNFQWLATGRWFSLGTPVSSRDKTYHHYIAEILLKVALNTISLTFIIKIIKNHQLTNHFLICFFFNKYWTC